MARSHTQRSAVKRPTRSTLVGVRVSQNSSSAREEAGPRGEVGDQQGGFLWSVPVTDPDQSGEFRDGVKVSPSVVQVGQRNGVLAS